MAVFIFLFVFVWGFCFVFGLPPNAKHYILSFVGSKLQDRVYHAGCLLKEVHVEVKRKNQEWTEE